KNSFADVDYDNISVVLSERSDAQLQAPGTPVKRNSFATSWIVVIHGNQVKDLPDSYKRYLMNYFRKSLEVMGTPIRIQFKEG
ncbi:hypothetical protein MJM04_36530, partial [Salmonella enterica subsp. enterica serovar Cerro]|nr:hypothetical protein [Salmonella enterica subsp. enterica serovar Cerro]